MGIQVFREIEIDFSNSRYIIINAKQHDSNSRFVRMTCKNLGQRVNLNPNDFSVFIRYRKPDGYGAFNKCIISTEGQVIFELTEQMLSTVGTSYADLVIIDVLKSDINNDLTIISADGNIIENNNSLVSTMTFYVNVLEKPLNDWDIESTNEFSALKDLLLKANVDYKNIKKYADLSQSYAVGTNGSIRPNDVTDNASAYAALAKKLTDQSQLLLNQAQNLMNAVSVGSIIPAGTVAFDNLPSSPKLGYMYNISNDFTTDNRFVEGSGINYSAGTNVYWTIYNKWDVFVGSNVVGVKGDNESIYRKGLVNITKEDIGLGNVKNLDINDQTPTFSLVSVRNNISSGEKMSIILGKIKKWFSDLKTVAFTGSYNDLTDKPNIPSNINIPTSLPANGGNSDTVDGKHADYLLDYNNLTNKPVFTMEGNTLKITFSDGSSLGGGGGSDDNNNKSEKIYIWDGKTLNGTLSTYGAGGGFKLENGKLKFKYSASTAGMTYKEVFNICLADLNFDTNTEYYYNIQGKGTLNFSGNGNCYFAWKLDGSEEITYGNPILWGYGFSYGSDVSNFPENGYFGNIEGKITLSNAKFLNFFIYMEENANCFIDIEFSEISFYNN